jgi:hypothetical protein
MVVRNLDFGGIAVLPAKADPKLIIDSNAVLANPIASEPLKTISRR